MINIVEFLVKKRLETHILSGKDFKDAVKKASQLIVVCELNNNHDISTVYFADVSGYKGSQDFIKRYDFTWDDFISLRILPSTLLNDKELKFADDVIDICKNISNPNITTLNLSIFNLNKRDNKHKKGFKLWVDKISELGVDIYDITNRMI